MERLIILAVPFFGPIFIGFLAGRFVKKPADGLAWLNYFTVYVALPPVFYQLISKTPFDQLTNIPFVFGALLSSYTAFSLAFVGGYLLLKGKIRDAVIVGGIGGYGNVGYMGPGLALAVLGQQAAPPMALIFCFDCILFFAIIPLLLAIHENNSDLRQTLINIAKRVGLNPFILATMMGVLAAYFQFQVPAALDRTLSFLMGAAAPSALFALGVTVAMRPLGKIPLEISFSIAIKLLIHPLIVYVVLLLLGPFDIVWIYTAILMAALPPALSVFVMASQYNTYVDKASSAVLMGTMLSVPTLLTWLYLIENRLIPVPS